MVSVICGSCVTSGCSQRRHYKSAWLVSRSDVARYVEQATHADSADARREAIVQLTKTRYADDDIVIEAYGQIAREDPNEIVRCVAVRALSQSSHENVVAALVDLAGPNVANETSGPTDRVRADILRGLEQLATQDRLTQDQMDASASIAVRSLRNQSNRDVQVASVILLGRLPRRASLDALIGTLNHPDYGVVYHARRSLEALTGQVFGDDPAAWRDWLSATESPFEHRGQWMPSDESQKTWWQRSAEEIRKAFTGTGTERGN